MYEHSMSSSGQSSARQADLRMTTISKAVSVVDGISIRSALLNFGSCLCLHSQSSMHIPSNMAEIYEKYSELQKSRLMFTVHMSGVKNTNVY
jgi:hypothetical protein